MHIILEFSKPHNLTQLHDELVAAVPTWLRSRLATPPEVGFEAMPDNGSILGGVSDAITIYVAADIDPALITTVIANHVPDSRLPLDPRKDRLSRIAEINAIPRSDWTDAQLRELMSLLAEEV